MLCSPLRHLLAVCATVCALVLLGAAPVAADVDCADLQTRSAAQSYLDGRSGDSDQLDADADGHACESSPSDNLSRWTLPGLVVLVLGALVLDQAIGRRRGGPRGGPRGGQAEPVHGEARTPVGVPAQRLPEQSGLSAATGRKRAVVDGASGGRILPSVADSS